MASTLQDGDLIALTPAPSTQGLIQALESTRAELRRFLIARTGSEAEADDLVSELWIKVNGSHSGPVANPKNYLFKMANNLVLDRRRELQRRERREHDWTTARHGTSSTELADEAPTAEQSLIEREEIKELSEAIAKLPAGAQRVLRLHKLDGLSHGEVAERLGISKSAVEKHMAVAMTHLRRLLAAEVRDAPRRLKEGGGPDTV